MNDKLHASATHTIRWNLLGSITFELAKAAHHVGLYLALTTIPYAHISVLFSLIYLTAFFGGLEGGNALLPHLKSIRQSPRASSFILRKLLAPQSALYATAAYLLGWHLTTHVGASSLEATLASIIVITEGLRSSMRAILHPLYGAKKVTTIEHPLTAGYFLYIWSGYLSNNFPLTPARLLAPFALTSCIAVGIFIYKVWRLPSGANPNTKLPNTNDLIKGRLVLCALHLPRNIFSGNLLVPVFAASVGPAFAAATKLTSEVANAVRALLKTTIGVSLNTLFTMFTKREYQRDAFSILWQQLNEVLVSAAIIFACLLPHMYNGTATSLGVLLGLFIGIATIDYLFIIYEHLYIMNKQAGQMAQYRGIEAAMGIGSIFIASGRPIIVLASISVIKIVVWYHAMHNAHTRWQVQPHAKIRPLVVGCAIILGALLSRGVSIVKYRQRSKEHKALQQSAARPSPLFQVKHPSQ
ncbi:MAG: hypothetical protein PVJ92_02235 [Candidatus Dependentiae bacterium]|jgi:hypothetical protein